MATTIQLLRSDIANQRPDPGVLANGVPMVNLHETEPGLFFSDRIGALFKVGPTAVGDTPPNTPAEGEPGNSKGETWLDTSGGSPVLKIYDGSAWVDCFQDPGGTVTSVGLSFSSIFSVSGSPVTTSGTLTATPVDQIKNTVFAGPETIDGVPSFRTLIESDIPALSAAKVTSGQFDSGRIPGLDASKISTGTFSDSHIPNLNASKITSGVLSHVIGGTGISSTPQNGDLLIGDSTGWVLSSLTAGPNVSVTNGAGSITVGVAASPTFSSILISDGGGDTVTISAPNVTVPYTIKLPVTDGTNGSILTTDGTGQLTFQTSLTGLSSIGGLASLTINAGGANGDVILAPTGSGTISASSSRITNLAAPTGSTDAATKAYVDTLAAGIQPKAQVVAATTTNIDLTTGGLLTIDTVTVSAGARILVKDQLFPEQNGIYEAALGSWTRAADTDVFAELVNAITFVAGGSANLGKTFLCNSPAGGTIGVDAVNWVLYSSGQGTVTSVGLSMPADFSVTNSPVTTSGALTVAYAVQSANTVFAGPTGGGGAAPTFRSLTAADIPSSLNSHTFTGSTTFQNTASFESGVDLGNDAGDLISINGAVDTSIIPTGTVSLGGSGAGQAWANVYTNDLHLSNEGHSNDIDGTWGSYTIQEGEEDLYLINRRSGKRYKFLLQEV